ncbi:uncharacterized protein HMPREF1541_03726 [Cyphellophora europaea CBS 101466]|uniref:Glutamate-1-semialdehyde 2,1-aminomutase n=1 Tax=Cyphellophora europaea (strain CBS 101466) TaxID=1220924 RepID=W2S1E3_CYPE1|nr:uncharacterized protein HMPREF1541_03726 [Cyphellophora europaea CBS 101466]ETN41789.1 hypothetical protein HMPREF1541_03726 [Cyphellophora europaea CBS 101466]
MGSINEPSSASASAAISAALEAATASYIKSNPESYRTHQAASAHLPGGNTRTVLYTAPFPLTFASAAGATLTTVDGAVLTDFLSEYTAAIYGHSHAVIRAAITSALDKGWNYGGHSGNEGRLAELISQRFPAMQMLRFVNSGTEANMVALATACAYTGRNNILLFNKGYHGSTISGRLDTRPAAGKVSLNLPHAFHVATYNDAESARQTVGALPRDSLAAILVEPMLGSGGCFRGTPEFLTALRRLADDTGALLIFDEVMTSRLGPHGLGAAAGPAGVTPDLMTLGKWVGGGMSFGAFGGRRDIMSWFDPAAGKLEHPGTFNNNVFTMAAGVAGLGVLTPEVLADLNGRGDRLRQSIDAVLRRHGLGTGYTPSTATTTTGGDAVLPWHPLTDAEHEDPAVYERYPPMFVTGHGSLLCVHFVGLDKGKLQQLFWLWMLSRGIWLAFRGFVALNIELRDEDVERFVGAVEGFVEKYGGVLAW